MPLLGDLLKYADSNGESFGNLIGRVEGWTIALALATELNQEYNSALDDMGAAQGRTARAFDTVTQGIGAQAFQWEQLIVKGEVFLQKIQQGLAPALGDLLDALEPVADKAIELAQAFADLDSKTQRQIVNWGLFAIALGPALKLIGMAVTLFRGLGAAIAFVAPLVGRLLLGMTWPLALLMAAITLLGIAWHQNWGNIQGRTAAARAAIIPHIDAIKASYESWSQSVMNTDFSSWDRFMASMASNRATFVQMMSDIGNATRDAINAFAGFELIGRPIERIGIWIDNAKAKIIELGVQAVQLGAKLILPFIASRAAIGMLRSISKPVSGRRSPTFRRPSPSLASESKVALTAPSLPPETPSQVSGPHSQSIGQASAIAFLAV